MTKHREAMNKMSVHPTDVEGLREQIARIVDREGWDVFDAVAAYQSKPQGEAPWSDAWSDKAWEGKVRADRSLSKADQILSLLSQERATVGGDSLAREPSPTTCRGAEPAALATRDAPDTYDAGLLNDYGGGNVEWWWDYIRYLLADAHEFYAARFDDVPEPPEGA